jgi:hypothetical protein
MSKSQQQSEVMKIGVDGPPRSPNPATVSIDIENQKDKMTPELADDIEFVVKNQPLFITSQHTHPYLITTEDHNNQQSIVKQLCGLGNSGGGYILKSRSNGYDPITGRISEGFPKSKETSILQR